jgi:hypothetical protein
MDNNVKYHVRCLTMAVNLIKRDTTTVCVVKVYNQVLGRRLLPHKCIWRVIVTAVYMKRHRKTRSIKTIRVIRMDHFILLFLIMPHKQWNHYYKNAL